MSIKTLRRIVRAKWFLIKLVAFLVKAFDVLLYIICSLFLLALVSIGLYYGINIFINEEVLHYYALGVLTILAAGLSIAYINKFNKKYRKNDSDSSKGQNDFLFEADLLLGERHHTN